MLFMYDVALQKKNGISGCNHMNFNFAVFSRYVEPFHVHYASDSMVV